MINRLFTWMGEDGMKHVICSAFICALLNIIICPFGACFVTFFIGVFKEAYDQATGEGTPEFKDIVCNAIGIGIATIATL